MIDLDPVYDGESGPIRRFQLDDGGSPIDLNSAAVEIHVYDIEGNFIARRVGVPVSPKTTGYVDLMLLGLESDYDGLGKELVLRPKIFAAVDPNGDPASNVAVNGSFDTDSNADGIPDNWSLQGSLAVGDPLSVGCWHRATGSPGVGGELDTHAIFYRPGAEASAYARFRITPRDWYFVTSTRIVTAATATVTFGVDARGTTLDNRFDDLFAFKGTWREPTVEPLRISVKPRARPLKAVNVLDGVGSLEYDSDADGLADGVSKTNATGVTFAHEKLPTNVHVGAASQKVTLAAFTGKKIEILKRGRYAAGTWRASCRVKTNGALTGAPTTGQWAIRLESDDFTDDLAAVNGGIADFGTNLGSFTLYESTLVLASARSALRVAIYLNGVTGDAWIDDVRLWRVS